MRPSVTSVEQTHTFLRCEHTGCGPDGPDPLEVPEGVNGYQAERGVGSACVVLRYSLRVRLSQRISQLEAVPFSPPHYKTSSTEGVLAQRAAGERSAHRRIRRRRRRRRTRRTRRAAAAHGHNEVQSVSITKRSGTTKPKK